METYEFNRISQFADLLIAIVAWAKNKYPSVALLLLSYNTSVHLLHLINWISQFL